MKNPAITQVEIHETIAVARVFLKRMTTLLQQRMQHLVSRGWSPLRIHQRDAIRETREPEHIRLVDLVHVDLGDVELDQCIGAAVAEQHVDRGARVELRSFFVPRRPHREEIAVLTDLAAHRVCAQQACENYTVTTVRSNV